MKRLFFLLLGVLVTIASSAFAGLPIPEQPLWAPIVDEVYLQEVGSVVETEQPLKAVAVFRQQAYVGGSHGVSVIENETLRQLEGPKGEVSRLKTLGGALWASSSDGLWRYDGTEWTRVTPQPVADLCEHNGQVVVALDTALHTVEGNVVTPLTEAGTTRLLGVTSYGGTVYVHDGRRVGLVERGNHPD